MGNKPMIYLLGPAWTGWVEVLAGQLEPDFTIAHHTVVTAGTRDEIRKARAVLYYRLDGSETNGALAQYAADRRIPVVVAGPRLHDHWELTRVSPALADITEAVFSDTRAATKYIKDNLLLPEDAQSISTFDFRPTNRLQYDYRTGEVSTQGPVDVVSTQQGNGAMNDSLTVGHIRVGGSPVHINQFSKL